MFRIPYVCVRFLHKQMYLCVCMHMSWADAWEKYLEKKLAFLDSKYESVSEEIIGEFWPLALQRYSS